jgi:hypothetical protein
MALTGEDGAMTYPRNYVSALRNQKVDKVFRYLVGYIAMISCDSDWSKTILIWLWVRNRGLILQVPR